MNKVFFTRKTGSPRILLKYKFDKKINDAIKVVDKSARWNANEEAWEGDARLLLNYVEYFKEKYIYMNLTIKMAEFLGTNRSGKTPEEVEKYRQWLENHESNARDSDTFDPSYLKFREGFNLYGYQKAGIEYIIDKNGRALLADEMGLGKTVQAIGFAKHYTNDWPVLVIAPASLLFNWKKEFLTWLPDLHEDDITIIKKSSQKPKGKITIASYDYASKKALWINQYMGVRGVLIVDECHNVKNPEAQRTQGLLQVAHATKRVLFMSGTPILNKPIELFTQINALYPQMFPDYIEFAKKYCDAKMHPKYGWDFSGASRLEELNKLLRDNFMVRRLKNDVLTQLPEKRRTTLYVDVTSDKDSMLEQLTDELKTMIRESLLSNGGDLVDAKRSLLSYTPSDEDGDKSSAKAMALEAYRLSGLAKLPFIVDWVQDKLDNEIDKLIIFGHHKEFLDGVEDKIKDMNLGYMRIDGTTPKETRFDYTESFQNDPTCQVAILSINAASVGLTLTAASNVLMGELPFTPGVALQAEDRVHRNGQLNGCNIYYAIGNDTVDPALWNNLMRKNEVANNALDGGFGTELDESFELSNGVLESLITEVSIEIQKEKEALLP